MINRNYDHSGEKYTAPTVEIVDSEDILTGSWDLPEIDNDW